MAYESRKLKEHEQRYSTYNLELTIVVHALKVWCHYLLGKKFVLMTNHRSLTNFFKQPNLNARQAWWKTFLSDFDFDIRHLKGNENRVADALRKKVQCVYEIRYHRVEFDVTEKIKEATLKDLEYTFLW